MMKYIPQSKLSKTWTSHRNVLKAASFFKIYGAQMAVGENHIQQTESVNEKLNP
jgi:hypothetical protein